MRARITPASDNIFRDLGFSEEEAQNLELRSRLMLELREVIERRGLTQAAAATLFGVSQPRVSDLVRGKINLFSIDTLLLMLRSAGHSVALATHPTRGEDDALTAPSASSTTEDEWVRSEAEFVSAGDPTPQEARPTAAYLISDWISFNIGHPFCTQAA